MSGGEEKGQAAVWVEGRDTCLPALLLRHSASTHRQGGRGAEEETKLPQVEESTSCLLCQPLAAHSSFTADDSPLPVVPIWLYLNQEVPPLPYPQTPH